VTDSRMNRVKGILAGAPNGPIGVTPTGGITMGPNGGHHGEAPEQAIAPPELGGHQALQVLTLAQRTADEHLAKAHRDADRIRADARAMAEQIARDAEAHAGNVRTDANKMLSDAREAAAESAREAKARADEAERNAGKLVAEAQARAQAIAVDARAKSEELQAQADQRYQDVVGSLATKREALQEQIEALEHFDREYRNRLQTFMQGQLRALWVEQPTVNDEDLEAAGPPADRKA
jgi:cell division septum initiation protein DivIVA